MIRLRSSCIARFALRVMLSGLLLAIGGCGGPVLVDTPVLYAGAAEDPFAGVAPTQREPAVTLIYGTDRLPEQTEKEDAAPLRYGPGRARALTVGTVRVQIGEQLTWEQIVAESRTAERSVELPIAVDPPQPAATFAVSDNPAAVEGDRLVEDERDTATNARGVEAMHKLLADRLADADRKDVFVFVHGYANRFDDAAIRMAQLWHFLGRPGVGVIYSWPAGFEGGALRGYTRDRESGEYSVYHFKQFIRAIASCPQVRTIHFIGHSRGTDVLMTALRELHIAHGNDPRRTREALKLGQVVLAAPDLDYEVAGQRITAERLGAAAQAMTIYLNAHDRAIGISDWLFSSARRLGQLVASDLTDRQREAFERASMRIAFVAVHVKTDFTGHGYFVSNPSVISDLILVLRDGRAPGAANGRPLIPREGGFWELYEGYPAPQK